MGTGYTQKAACPATCTAPSTGPFIINCSHPVPHKIASTLNSKYTWSARVLVSGVPIPHLALCSPTHHNRQTAFEDGCLLISTGLAATVGWELAHF